MCPQIDPKRMDKRGMRFVWNAGPSEEAKIMLVISLLGERALLWRVRQCVSRDVSILLAELEGRKPQPLCCGKWFYARRTDQKFCGKAICRQRAYSSRKKSPGDKAKRAAYMRNYRRSLRERDQGLIESIRPRPKRKAR
jgi:hypothetical protein